MEFNSAFDLIYFRCICSGKKQAEMWTCRNFAKLYDSMTAGGILVTYCVERVVEEHYKLLVFS